MNKRPIRKGSGQTNIKHDSTPVVSTGDQDRQRMMCPQQKRAPKPPGEFGRVSGVQEGLSEEVTLQLGLPEGSGVSYVHCFVKALRTRLGWRNET